MTTSWKLGFLGSGPRGVSFRYVALPFAFPITVISFFPVLSRIVNFACDIPMKSNVTETSARLSPGGIDTPCGSLDSLAMVKLDSIQPLIAHAEIHTATIRPNLFVSRNIFNIDLTSDFVTLAFILPAHGKTLCNTPAAAAPLAFLAHALAGYYLPSFNTSSRRVASVSMMFPNQVEGAPVPCVGNRGLKTPYRPARSLTESRQVVIELPRKGT